MKTTTVIVSALTFVGTLVSWSSPLIGAAPAESPRTVLSQLLGPDTLAVLHAKAELENFQSAALAAILEQLRRPEKRCLLLTDTDLVVLPGDSGGRDYATVVQYDLRWSRVRVGWVLESLVFVPFGFAHQRSKRSTKLLSDTSAHLETNKAVQRAIAWLSALPALGKWSRLDACVAALDSGDAERILPTLRWLRYGTTGCTGLTPEVYLARVEPRVTALSKHGDQFVRREAELLRTAGLSRDIVSPPRWCRRSNFVVRCRSGANEACPPGCSSKRVPLR